MSSGIKKVGTEIPKFTSISKIGWSERDRRSLTIIDRIMSHDHSQSWLLGSNKYEPHSLMIGNDREWSPITFRSPYHWWDAMLSYPSIKYLHKNAVKIGNCPLICFWLENYILSKNIHIYMYVSAIIQNLHCWVRDIGGPNLS